MNVVGGNSGRTGAPVPAFRRWVRRRTSVRHLLSRAARQTNDPALSEQLREASLAAEDMTTALMISQGLTRDEAVAVVLEHPAFSTAARVAEKIVAVRAA